MDRKVYLTLKGKFSARIADSTKAGDLGIVVEDNVGETVIENLDQENTNIKLGKKGKISGDTILKISMVVDDEVDIGDAVSELSFFLEDSNPKSKRVQHGFSLIDNFKIKLTGWEVTDSK